MLRATHFLTKTLESWFRGRINCLYKNGSVLINKTDSHSSTLHLPIVAPNHSIDNLINTIHRLNIFHTAFYNLEFTISLSIHRPSRLATSKTFNTIYRLLPPTLSFIQAK
jgi:phospholipid N-methyltransferase